MSFLFLKWPSKLQWRQFFKVLSKKEKIVFFVFLFLAFSSFLFLSNNFYLKNTEIKPAKGGTYIEGVVGSPRFINPLYSQTNDVDRDLTELIYSGLMKHNEEGKVVIDLAKEYKIIEDGKIFEFYLKENLLWSDGKSLTADDVIFTIKTIQDPSSKSPIRASWLGVKVEKISDLGIRFELKNSSAVFLENCTLKIMPKHIWEDISDQNFSLSIYNLKPIGSGPYKVKKITQDKEGNIKSLELTINSNYYGNLPNIPKIIFSFFKNEDELIFAFNSNQIKGFSLISSSEKHQNLKGNDFSNNRLLMPRYFAVFFNPDESKILADKKVRLALSYGTNKEEIINLVLPNQGRTVDSPILPEIYGFENPSKIYEFDLEKAKQILEEAGFIEKENGMREKVIRKEPAFQFKSDLQVGSQESEVQELQKCLTKDPDVYPEGEITGYFGEKTKEAVIKFQEKYKEEILTPYGLTAGTGRVLKSTRDKLNQLCAAPSEETLSLSFTLTTSVATTTNQILAEVANLLKNQWGKIGINIEVKVIDSKLFPEEIIRPRNYEMILFGQGLELILDPFPYWHSSQIKDPGLNLAGYENKESDKLLEEARQSLNEEKRKIALEKFQNILIEDAPAIFLYSPDYLYLTSKEIKGVSVKIITDPSKRFSDIENWYIKTKRVWR
ncbi:MAG: ABC transporter substrate-binding protein [Candidatus Nealsonbacteria bacterium]|nr:ABC transporter substrate-binding protein [Candidatus Nealsonbacteria bacterium]